MKCVCANCLVYAEMILYNKKFTHNSSLTFQAVKTSSLVNRVALWDGNGADGDKPHSVVSSALSIKLCSKRESQYIHSQSSEAFRNGPAFFGSGVGAVFLGGVSSVGRQRPCSQTLPSSVSAWLYRFDRIWLQALFC